LNSEVEEEAYVSQPDGFFSSGPRKESMQAHNILVWPKASTKAMTSKFDEVVLSLGFSINESNKCVYSKFDHWKGVIICLYIGDIWSSELI